MSRSLKICAQVESGTIMAGYSIVRFYTGLPSMEILMVVCEHISWHLSHVTRQTQSLNRFQDGVHYFTYQT